MIVIDLFVFQGQLSAVSAWLYTCHLYWLYSLCFYLMLLWLINQQLGIRINAGKTEVKLKAKLNQ